MIKPAAMPTLQNVRQETFCQLIAKSPKTGWHQGKCYTEAGFKTANRSADACAARLLTRANIKTRIAELIEPAVRKTGVTVASLLNELEQARVAAHDDRQFSASVQAIAGKAKLAGLDRENGGAGSEFSKCASIDEVLRVLLTHLSPGDALQQLDDLRGLIVAHAADHANVVGTEYVRPRTPGTETEMALRLLKPAFKR